MVALFDTTQTAEQAIQDLLQNGVNRDQISLITRPPEKDAQPEAGNQSTDQLPSPIKAESAENLDPYAKQGAALGAALGGLGGILLGLSVVAIPGLGAVIAAGPLVAALSGISGAGVGALAGASAGGLLGALTQTGLTTEEASAYLEGLRQGKVLVAVQTEDDRAGPVQEILKKHHPVGIGDQSSGSDIFPGKG